MYVSVRHDKLGNLKQHKKRQGSIIMAHCHRVVGVRALAPFDLRLGLSGRGGARGVAWPTVSWGVFGGWLWFSCGVAHSGGELVCFSGIFC